MEVGSFAGSLSQNLVLGSPALESHGPVFTKADC